MRAVKRVLSQFHRYLLWLMLSVFLWAWIFFMITDTTKARKVTVYIDAPAVDDAGLSAALNSELPEGIRMVKVHPFSYAAFNTLSPADADIYIMSGSALMENLALLCPIEGALAEDAEDGLYADGMLYGLCLRSADGGYSAAGEYVAYEGDESYYICFNADSKHISVWRDGRDSAAVSVAERILGLP